MNSGPEKLPDHVVSGIVVRDRGTIDYTTSFEEMRRFTDQRTETTQDEIWLLEHPPVYTYGFNDRHEPFDNPGVIPVVQSDRGGQITFHGPGQLVVYTLIDLRRRGLGVKSLVQILEQSVIDLLARRHIVGTRRAGAPGIYVDGRKIAQLGLRIRRGGSYHGLSVNVCMDLEPFRRIKPCGYAGLETIDLASIAGRDQADMRLIRPELLDHLFRNLGYNRDRV